MRAAAKLTSKGQITIPIAVRQELQLDTGDRVDFVQIAPGRFEMIANTSHVTELKGMFSIPKKAVSIEAMNQAIAKRGASGK